MVATCYAPKLVSRRIGRLWNGRTVTARPRNPGDSGTPDRPDDAPSSRPRSHDGIGNVQQAQDAIAAKLGAAKADPTPYGTAHTSAGTTTPPTRDDIELSAIMNRYDRLGDEQPKFKIAAHDLAHPKAHTLERHGPDIPLAHIPGVKTIEGRVYGGHGWERRENQSFKWIDHTTMHNEINEYVRTNWETIRSDLAIGDSPHEAVINAGHRIGHGYYNSGMYGTGVRQAAYAETSWFKIRIRLTPGSDPPEPFIVSAFPAGIL